MVRAVDAARLNKDNGFYKSVTITNASVLTLFSVPYTLITAPTNAQMAICVQELFLRITAGTAYANLHDMNVLYGTSGAVISLVQGTGFLDQTAATGVWAAFDGTSSKGTIVSPGAAVNLQMLTADPTTGTSPITVKIKYKVHRVA